MHPFSILTLAIFVAGYITARWDLVTRLYDLAIFAWDHGVLVSSKALSDSHSKILIMNTQARTAKGFAILSLFFFLFIIPIERLASRETDLVGMNVHGALEIANAIVASTSWKCRDICEGTTSTARIILEGHPRRKSCHARA